jgi:hypothetical protein
MSKIIKIAKLLAQICGGWWSLMSGAISIPFAFLAIFVDMSHPHPKETFAILAFVALWIFAVRTAWANYKMIESSRLQLQLADKKFSIERQKMADQIQSLTSRLDDSEKRKKLKDALAGYRITIQNLTSQLHGISYYTYKEEIRQTFERDYLETENSAYQFLYEKVGRSEAVSFANIEQIPKVILGPEAQFDMEEFKASWVAKQFMLNRLKYNAEKIENIEQKLDSKDFILSLDSSDFLL